MYLLCVCIHVCLCTCMRAHVDSVGVSSLFPPVGPGNWTKVIRLGLHLLNHVTSPCPAFFMWVLGIQLDPYVCAASAVHPSSHLPSPTLCLFQIESRCVVWMTLEFLTSLPQPSE